ncbi:hypothetical protein U1Q18_000315 [Sarracenia purpurea var. burkii]
MDKPKLEGSQSVIGKNWEAALHLYENLIACGNETFQLRAIIQLARLADHAPENILARSVPVVVELLRSPCGGESNLSIQEAIVFCLNRITRRGEGKLAVIIGQSGAVPSLLKLLPNSNGRLQKVLLKCLRNIVTFGDANCIVVATNDGLEIVLDMLKACPDGLRRCLLEILSALAMLREVRRAIVNLGGLGFLVESAHCGSMASRTRAAHAIGLVGLVRRARRVLVDSGAISVLIELLRDGDFSTKLVAGNALGVIASHVDYIRPVARSGAIPLFVELIQGPELMGKEIAEDVLCILAAVEENTVTITEHLLRILKGDNDEAKAAAASVLWFLSSCKHLIVVVRKCGVIPILVELLRDGNVCVREKVSKAISQLSQYEDDRVALADAGAIPCLIDMLKDESEEARDNATEALISVFQNTTIRDRTFMALSWESLYDLQQLQSAWAFDISPQINEY